MGICWHSTGSSTKSNSQNLSNQMVIVSQQNPSVTNRNNLIQDKSEIIIKNDNNNINFVLNSSFEESLKMFPDMPEWGGGITSGYGIKQMPAYKCNLKIDELNKKREEFWASKTKNKTKWKIIHQACIYDHINAEDFLYKNDFKTVDGCINKCKDNEGYIYRVPNYCINDPHFELELLDKEESRGENIQIKLLDIKNQKQKIFNVLDSITGEELIKKYAEEEKIDLKKNKVRLLFGGGIIRENESLFQHKVKNGFLIQICITPII